MPTSTDVKAATVTATGSVYGDRTRVKAISFIGTDAGSIVLRDGGASGQVELNFATSTGQGLFYFPGDGILFNKNVHATLTNVSSLTVIYG